MENKRSVLILVLLILFGGVCYYLYNKSDQSIQGNDINGKIEETAIYQNIIKQNLEEPYAIFWKGWNRANIYLTGVSLSKEIDKGNILSLFFKVNTADGGFCGNNLGSLRILSEDSFLSPIKIPVDCISSYSTLLDQEVSFMVPSSQTEFIVGGSTYENNMISELFKINIIDDFKKVETVLLNNVKDIIYSKNFSSPYPFSFNELGIKFDLMGVSLENASEESNNLVLSFKIFNTTDKALCVENNFRLEINEDGEMLHPNDKQFHFPKSGGCIIEDHVSYSDQKVIFNVSKEDRSFGITTGKNTNIFFNIDILENGEIEIEK